MAEEDEEFLINLFLDFGSESLKKKLQEEELWSTVTKLKNDWCQSKGNSATELEETLSFFRYIITVGLPQPHNKSDLDTGMSTKDLREHCGKALKLMRILIILLNHVTLEDPDLPTQHQLSSRYLFKAISCPLVVLCAIYMMSWKQSIQGAKTRAEELLHVACNGCHCSTVTELLSGCVEVNESAEKMDPKTFEHDQHLFPTGLLGQIIVYLRSYLTKENWKRHSSYLYALSWCVHQVKHPFLGEHFPSILPALLFMVDDYQIENKVKGIECLNHVVNNVNAAELRWYGRADVIFEALQRLIYTNEPEIIQVLHPCILSVLKVIEDSPRKPKPGRKANKCDTVFQVILTSMEFEGKVPMRRAYAQHLKDFVEHMGITLLRHFKRLLPVIFSYLAVYDGPEEAVRISLLDCLQAAILHTWPRVPFHSQEILKSLLKLLVDISDSCESISPKAHEILISKTVSCLTLLRLCCGKPFEDQLMALRDGIGHEVTKRCLSKSLTSDFESLQDTCHETR